MITLLSHTLHALQPLDVACFKPFKIIFNGERNTLMFNKNYIEPNKLALARWVDKAFDQALMKNNIMLGFKGISIQPLNLKAMDEKTNPCTIYTLVN